MNNTEYVGRAALKLELANSKFNIDFRGKTVLDVGSSTGGFTDYALKSGADKVIAIERGSKQMSSPLRFDPRIELHEKTSILEVKNLSFVPDVTVVDLSFVSLKTILPHLYNLVGAITQLMVLVKPQFEAKAEEKNRGIIKNEAIRRAVFKDFELWVKKHFVILDKIDSGVLGSKGNKERFYLLKKNPGS